MIILSYQMLALGKKRRTTENKQHCLFEILDLERLTKYHTASTRRFYKDDVRNTRRNND